MTQDQDARLANLLREDAPPAHDPLFRLSVLERREQKRFRNRSFLLLAAALAFAAISWIVINAGGQVFETAGVMLFGAILAVGHFLYAPALMQLLRRFRI
jgi:hypothetical protein